MAESFRVIALMSAYNEADIISPVIEHLVQNGVEVYLLDHGSTDDTAELARQWLGRGVIGVETFPPAGDRRYANAGEKYDWTSILLRKEELAQTLNADWFIHHDADEIRESPWEGSTLAEAIRFVDRLDFNCIDFRIYEFPPINDAFTQGMDPRTHFTHCREAQQFDQLQLKAWKAQSGRVSLVQYAGHDAAFEGKRVFPIPFILRHYPVRSQTHGLRKVFQERKPRFSADERTKLWHIQYDHIEDENFSFLVDPALLRPFDLRRARLDVILRNRERAELTIRMAQLEGQLATLRSDLQTVNQHRDELASQLSVVNTALVEATHAKQADEERVRSLTETLASRQAEFDSHVAALEAGAARSIAELRMLTENRDELRAQVSVLSEVVQAKAAVDESVIDLQHAVSAANQQRAEMASKATALREALDRTTREREAAKVAADTHAATIADLRARASAMETELRHARGELSTVYASRTWRLGEPVGRFIQSMGVMRSRREDVSALSHQARTESRARSHADDRSRATQEGAEDSDQEPHGPLPEHLRVEVNAIRASGLFDESYYRVTYPDVSGERLDAIRHYCEQGWREGRNPSAGFDTRFYLDTYEDIRRGDMNPFYHYVIAGASELRHALPPASSPVGDVAEPSAEGRERKGIRQDGEMSEAVATEVQAIRNSGLFDEAYYRSMYPDVGAAPIDVVRHYCEVGWREGRNPSDDFDTQFYLKTYGDIRSGNMNPFYHYVIAGASELRHALPDMSTRLESDIYFGIIETDIKLIAFYEAPAWTPVRSGRPRFKGHRQPLLPHESLGFYDPADAHVLQQQADLARRHGLYGFCFSLGSERGDERHDPNPPIDSFLAHAEIDFRFCICVDLDSTDGPAVLSKAVSDPRYIRIANRPLIIFDVRDELDNARPSLTTFKGRLASQGIRNPFLIERREPEDTGPGGQSAESSCDAALELPRVAVPGETGTFVPLNRAWADGDVFPYSVVASQGVTRSQKSTTSAQPIYQAVSLGRDTTASRSSRPVVYTRFTVRDYRRWLDAAITAARDSHPCDRRLVFLNAWNRWSEGLFLEPDRAGGFNRLNETSRALLGIPTGTDMPKVSVIVPNFNHGPFLRRRLESIYGQTYTNIEVILLDDCSTDGSRAIIDEFASAHPDITRVLYNERNSGSPFRQWRKGIKAATGDLVWVAESDDYCDARFLEVLVRCFEDEAVLLASAKCVFVDRDEVPMPDEFQIYVRDLECAGKWNGRYVDTAHNEVRSSLGIKNTIPNASGVLFKRPIDLSLLDDESWLSMSVAGDWVFYLHVIRGGKIAYDPAATNYFRRYGGSAAEVTYKRAAFYSEVATASRTVAALYDVPVSVLERSRENYRATYRYHGGQSDEEFESWYDYDSVLRTRDSRLPNVMVSTMGFFPGGAEILPIRLANEFKRQNLSVLLLNAAFNPTEDGVRRMVRNDVPVVETSGVEEVRTLIRDFGIEALHTHQWHIQKYPLRCPDVFDRLKTHVASLHGMIEHGDAFAVTREQLLAADKAVGTWVYTAEKNLAPFKTTGLYDPSSDRFTKIPNGMEPPAVVAIPRADMHIPDDAFVLCCVSRAIPDKGWAEMVAVVARARVLSGRDIRLVLVGNGPVHDEYCRTGVPDFVYLAGFSEDSVGHYAASDMGIMLTKFKSESFPLTVVDCLFAGRPYIASDVGDIRNMLTTPRGVAGEVIELENWEVPIERAAAAVAAFATDSAKYSSAAALSSEAARRYRIDTVAAEYVRLFAKETSLANVMGPRR